MKNMMMTVIRKRRKIMMGMGLWWWGWGWGFNDCAGPAPLVLIKDCDEMKVMIQCTVSWLSCSGEIMATWWCGGRRLRFWLTSGGTTHCDDDNIISTKHTFAFEKMELLHFLHEPFKFKCGWGVCQRMNISSSEWWRQWLRWRRRRQWFDLICIVKTVVMIMLIMLVTMMMMMMMTMMILIILLLLMMIMMMMVDVVGFVGC